jgi:hypothetical protein
MEPPVIIAKVEIQGSRRVARLFPAAGTAVGLRCARTIVLDQLSDERELLGGCGLRARRKMPLCRR